MSVRNYNFGDLRRQLTESASEFKAKLGNGVESDNKRINNDAYKAIGKETKAYNGNLSNGKTANHGKSQMGEMNRGMSDLQYDSENKPFMEKVKSQMKGYVSADAEKKHKNDEFGNATFDDAIEKEAERHAQDAKKQQDVDSETGLVSRMKKKEDTHKHETTLGEAKKIKQLQFKNIQFLSEAHMMSQIPDPYKKDGNRFYMKDCKGNRYLVEWSEKPSIEKCINENQVTEDFGRIKELMGYRYGESTTNRQTRVNETKELDKMLGRVRELMK